MAPRAYWKGYGKRRRAEVARRVAASAQRPNMQIRPVIPLASVLAVMLASPAVEPFFAKLTATTKSAHVAQLPAPTGHRQPTCRLPFARQKSQAPRQAQRKIRKLAVQTSSKAIGKMGDDERRG